MPENQPTLEEWRGLYQAAMRFKELAPWQWMEESDIFGILNPESGEIGFASIMGMAGEHFAMSLYLGAKGLYGYWELDRAAPFFDAEMFFRIPQLQASFEDRTELQKADRDVMAKLGLKFRGRQAWPLFRSYRPAYAPWFLTGAEARFLTLALQQAVEVALRFKDDPEMLNPPDENSYFVRAPSSDGGAQWEDRWISVQPPDPLTLTLRIDGEILARASPLPKSKMNVQVDLFMAPGYIQERRNERPSVAYMLLAVEARGGFVLGVETMQALPSYQAMWERIPSLVTRMLLGGGAIPTQITVASELMASLLSPLEANLGIKIVQATTLGRLEQARAAFHRFIR